MVVLRLKYKQVSRTKPMAKCWYCEAPTNSALYELDGSEIWCCKKCYKKHGRVMKRISAKKKAKIPFKNTGKKDILMLSKEGMR